MPDICQLSPVLQLPNNFCDIQIGMQLTVVGVRWGCKGNPPRQIVGMAKTKYAECDCIKVVTTIAEALRDSIIEETQAKAKKDQLILEFKIQPLEQVEASASASHAEAARVLKRPAAPTGPATPSAPSTPIRRPATLCKQPEFLDDDVPFGISDLV